MTLPILNQNALTLPNHFLVVNKQDGKEVLAVERKGLLGRIWRALGFGNGSLIKVFKFLDHNPEFDLKKVTKANDADEIFYRTLTDYLEKNPKFTERTRKINHLVNIIYNISTEPSYKDYPDPKLFYDQYIKPLEFLRGFKTPSDRLNHLSNRYFSAFETSTHNETLNNILKKAEECPELAALCHKIPNVNLDHINTNEFEKCIQLFNSVNEITLWTMNIEKLKVLKDFNGTFNILFSTLPKELNGLEGFKAKQLELSLTYNGNLSTFPSMKLRQLCFYDVVGFKKNELNQFCKRVRAKKIIFYHVTDKIQESDIAADSGYTPSFYEGFLILTRVR